MSNPSTPDNLKKSDAAQLGVTPAVSAVSAAAAAAPNVGAEGSDGGILAIQDSSTEDLAFVTRLAETGAKKAPGKFELTVNFTKTVIEKQESHVTNDHRRSTTTYNNAQSSDNAAILANTETIKNQLGRVVSNQTEQGQAINTIVGNTAVKAPNENAVDNGAFTTPGSATRRELFPSDLDDAAAAADGAPADVTNILQAALTQNIDHHPSPCLAKRLEWLRQELAQFEVLLPEQMPGDLVDSDTPLPDYGQVAFTFQEHEGERKVVAIILQILCGEDIERSQRYAEESAIGDLMSVKFGTRSETWYVDLTLHQGEPKAFALYVHPAPSKTAAAMIAVPAIISKVARIAEESGDAVTNVCLESPKSDKDRKNLAVDVPDLYASLPPRCNLTLQKFTISTYDQTELAKRRVAIVLMLRNCDLDEHGGRIPEYRGLMLERKEIDPEDTSQRFTLWLMDTKMGSSSNLALRDALSRGAITNLFYSSLDDCFEKFHKEDLTLLADTGRFRQNKNEDDLLPEQNSPPPAAQADSVAGGSSIGTGASSFGSGAAAGATDAAEEGQLGEEPTGATQDKKPVALIQAAGAASGEKLHPVNLRREEEYEDHLQKVIDNSKESDDESSKESAYDYGSDDDVANETDEKKNGNEEADADAKPRAESSASGSSFGAEAEAENEDKKLAEKETAEDEEEDQPEVEGEDDDDGGAGIEDGKEAPDFFLKEGGWGSTFGVEEGSWKCESCMVQNKAAAIKCAACETIRPGYEDQEAEQSSAAASGSSVGAGGFSFGGGSAFGGDTAPTGGSSFGAPAPAASTAPTSNGFSVGTTPAPAPAAAGFCVGQRVQDTTKGGHNKGLFGTVTEVCSKLTVKVKFVDVDGVVKKAVQRPTRYLTVVGPTSGGGAVAGSASAFDGRSSVGAGGSSTFGGTTPAGGLSFGGTGSDAASAAPFDSADFAFDTNLEEEGQDDRKPEAIYTDAE